VKIFYVCLPSRFIMIYVGRRIEIYSAGVENSLMISGTAW
jgi:hypothetical protein